MLYTESGLYPLECEIMKRQLKFWKAITSDDNQLPYIQLLVQYGLNANIPFSQYYTDLEVFSDLQQEYKISWKANITNVFNADKNSHMGTYLIINPSLCTANLPKKLPYRI